MSFFDSHIQFLTSIVPTGKKKNRLIYIRIDLDYSPCLGSNVASRTLYYLSLAYLANFHTTKELGKGREGEKEVGKKTE